MAEEALALLQGVVESPRKIVAVSALSVRGLYGFLRGRGHDAHLDLDIYAIYMRDFRYDRYRNGFRTPRDESIALVQYGRGEKMYVL